MPGPEAAPEPDEARLIAELAAAGLILAPEQVPGVLDTARYLHRARALVERYLQSRNDEPG